MYDILKYMQCMLTRAEFTREYYNGTMVITWQTTRAWSIIISYVGLPLWIHHRTWGTGFTLWGPIPQNNHQRLCHLLSQMTQDLSEPHSDIIITWSLFYQSFHWYTIHDLLPYKIPCVSLKINFLSMCFIWRCY